MAVAKLKKKQGVVKYQSQRNKSDWMVIKLTKTGKTDVVLKELGESLIKRKRATEVKNVDFDLLQGNIKYIGDVEDKK